jgi:hypothetical protein
MHCVVCNALGVCTACIVRGVVPPATILLQKTPFFKQKTLFVGLDLGFGSAMKIGLLLDLYVAAHAYACDIMPRLLWMAACSPYNVLHCVSLNLKAVEAHVAVVLQINAHQTTIDATKAAVTAATATTKNAAATAIIQTASKMSSAAYADGVDDLTEVLPSVDEQRLQRRGNPTEVLPAVDEQRLQRRGNLTEVLPAVDEQRVQRHSIEEGDGAPAAAAVDGGADRSAEAAPCAPINATATDTPPAAVADTGGCINRDGGRRRSFSSSHSDADTLLTMTERQTIRAKSRKYSMEQYSSRFPAEFYTEDDIGSHAGSLEALACVCPMPFLSGGHFLTGLHC